MQKFVVAFAMLCITILEIAAICYDIDGGAFGVAVAAIAGLGGFTIGKAITGSKKE